MFTLNEPVRSRKVLLVLEATQGGTGRHGLDLARGLLERGDEVHLVYSDLRADVQFLRGLESLQSEWPAFRSECIRVARAVALSDLQAFWRFSWYLKRNGPFDIVHGHSTKAGFLVRLLPGAGGAARLYTPHALMTMNPGLRGIRRWAVSALETLLAMRSTAVVVVSRDEWRCAVETGIPEDKLVLIENGVDLEGLARRAAKRGQIRSSLGVAPEAFCVGFIGRFTEQKKPLRVLEAFSIFRSKANGPVKLVMIGSGPLESALRVRAAGLKMEADVIWAGPVDGAAYVAGFDLLAQTSIYEGFAYVVLEALGSGVPFVSTKVGASEELAQGGAAGLLCEPFSPERFGELMLRLHDDPVLRGSMSEAAKRTAAEYGLARMLDRISELYGKAAPDHTSRAMKFRVAAGGSK